MAALLVRAKIKFSGESGAVVASGIESDAATAKTPTFGHVRAALDIVNDELDDALFDPHAEHRPCGVLDRYEAAGMLLGDACGLPLMPARPQGLAIGNKARKMPPKIAAAIEAAKKRAKRRGADVAEAEAAVLRQPADIDIPSAAECVAAVMPAPAPALAPVAEPEPVAEGACRIVHVAAAPPPVTELPIPADELQVVESREMALALDAAADAERAWRDLDEWPEPDEDDEEYIHHQEEVERTTLAYRHRLQALWRVSPELAQFGASPAQLAQGLRASASNSTPCACGGGKRIAVMPWVLHRSEWGFCDCQDGGAQDYGGMLWQTRFDIMGQFGM